MDEPRLLRSPLNSLGEPRGKDRKFGSAARLPVLARMVWPNQIVIVPATAVWVSHDRICVEWSGPRSDQTRQTWLPRSDVRAQLVYGRAY